MITLWVRILNFAKQNELKSPKKTPINTDKIASLRKLPKISNGVTQENSLSGPENSMTVLKRMMQTASLVIPSPKIKLKSLGYSSYFTIDIAATTSVQHKSEHINKISITDRVKGSYIL
jgi:hypothetical protein